METFWETDYRTRDNILKSFTVAFYEKHKGNINVLSSEDVYKRHDKSAIFSTTIWNNKIFLKDWYSGASNLRKLHPVIFGLESGICFKYDRIFFLYGKEETDYFDLHPKYIGDLVFSGDIIFPSAGNKNSSLKSTYSDITILRKFADELKAVVDGFNGKIKFEKQLNNITFKKEQTNVLQEFDKDGDGNIDLMENDFGKLLTANQKKIQEVDKTYIHKFVKVSNYLKIKRENIQEIFQSIKNADNITELENRVGYLKNQIYVYELLLFHSINMVGAAVEEEMIIFYEIYESFDKLGMFNSTWENEVAQRLKNIELKLDELLHEINDMEYKIVREIKNLNYTMQDSFESLGKSIGQQLEKVSSKINFSNLLSSIQTYQLYKINQQTKSLGK